jgi:hypothetical protein
VIAETGAAERQKLYALYKPGIGGGNYQADVRNRGWNAAIAKVLEELGLDIPKRIERRFKVMDEQDWDRSQVRLDEINFEARVSR